MHKLLFARTNFIRVLNMLSLASMMWWHCGNIERRQRFYETNGTTVQRVQRAIDLGCTWCAWRAPCTVHQPRPARRPPPSARLHITTTHYSTLSESWLKLSMNGCIDLYSLFFLHQIIFHRAATTCWPYCTFYRMQRKLIALIAGRQNYSSRRRSLQGVQRLLLTTRLFLSNLVVCTYIRIKYFLLIFVGDQLL